jgi:hypothetical protein
VRTSSAARVKSTRKRRRLDLIHGSLVLGLDPVELVRFAAVYGKPVEWFLA